MQHIERQVLVKLLLIQLQVRVERRRSWVHNQDTIDNFTTRFPSETVDQTEQAVDGLILTVKDELLAFLDVFLDSLDPREGFVRRGNLDEFGGFGANPFSEQDEVFKPGVVDGDDVVFVGVVFGVDALLLAGDRETFVAEGAETLAKDLRAQEGDKLKVWLILCKRLGPYSRCHSVSGRGSAL